MRPAQAKPVKKLVKYPLYRPIYLIEVEVFSMARRPDVIMLLGCLVLVGALAMVAVQFIESHAIMLPYIQTIFSFTDSYYLKLR